MYSIPLRQCCCIWTRSSFISFFSLLSLFVIYPIHQGILCNSCVGKLFSYNITSNKNTHTTLLEWFILFCDISVVLSSVGCVCVCVCSLFILIPKGSTFTNVMTHTCAAEQRHLCVCVCSGSYAHSRTHTLHHLVNIVGQDQPLSQPTNNKRNVKLINFWPAPIPSLF